MSLSLPATTPSFVAGPAGNTGASAGAPQPSGAAAGVERGVFERLLERHASDDEPPYGSSKAPGRSDGDRVDDLRGAALDRRPRDQQGRDDRDDDRDPTPGAGSDGRTVAGRDADGRCRIRSDTGDGALGPSDGQTPFGAALLPSLPQLAAPNASSLMLDPGLAPAGTGGAAAARIQSVLAADAAGADPSLAPGAAACYEVSFGGPDGLGLQMQAIRAADAPGAHAGAWTLTLGSAAVDGATLARHAPQLQERLSVGSGIRTHMRIDGQGGQGGNGGSGGHRRNGR